MCVCVCVLLFLTSVGLVPSIVYTTAMGSDFDNRSKSSRFLQEMCSSTFVERVPGGP